MKRVFVLSAPSGTGKTTMAARLKQEVPGLFIPVTYTTKNPRPEEVEGRDYRFVSREKFLEMIRLGEFLEWAEVYGNCYGTPRKEVEEQLKLGRKVLLTIDTQGGLSVRRIFPQAFLVGLLPPSLAEQEGRIRKRSGLSEKEIRQRIEAARIERRVLKEEYDIRLVNRNLETTLEKIKKIITGK